MDEDLPTLSPALVRDAAEGFCPRRIALQHAGDRGSRRSRASFRVSDALRAHARLAQLEHGPPRVEAFTGDDDLVPEEQRLYDHAVAWYLALYGERPGRSVDLGDLEWGLDRPDLGVRLTSAPPLAFDVDDALEARVLRLDGRAPPEHPAGTDEGQMLVARLAPLVAGRPLRLSFADLVNGEHYEDVVDVAAATEGVEARLAESLATVRAAADRDRPRIGRDCGWCRFVTRCPEHKPRG